MTPTGRVRVVAGRGRRGCTGAARPARLGATNDRGVVPARRRALGLREVVGEPAEAASLQGHGGVRPEDGGEAVEAVDAKLVEFVEVLGDLVALVREPLDQVV